MIPSLLLIKSYLSKFKTKKAKSLIIILSILICLLFLGEFAESAGRSFAK